MNQRDVDAMVARLNRLATQKAGLDVRLRRLEALEARDAQRRQEAQGDLAGDLAAQRPPLTHIDLLTYDSAGRPLQPVRKEG